MALAMLRRSVAGDGGTELFGEYGAGVLMLVALSSLFLPQH